MSPILLRPVREQLEHDRVIRLLQAKYKRKFDVSINPGSLQAAPVGTGARSWYPDLVLRSTERSRKLLGVVEVETTESVTHLEAMSQWVPFARLRAAFHLYVPAAEVDTTRRLCAGLKITVSEIWAFATFGDQVRFTLIQRAGPALERKAKGSATTRSSGASARKTGSGQRAGSGKARPKSTRRRPAAAAKKKTLPTAAKKSSRPTPSKSRPAAKTTPRRSSTKKSVRRSQKRK